MWEVKIDDMTLNASPTLEGAMLYARDYNKFVTITDGVTEIVGRFGVDSIKENMCPDGVEYNWRKRR